MILPTWMLDALRSESAPLQGCYFRCVEAQHIVSTLSLVDTLDEQALLEDILEGSKPKVPPTCQGLHYLYMTPFRYGLYPHGSRFRRAGQSPGVYYVSASEETAIAETAFHLLLFFAESPQTPLPKATTEHSVFDVPVRARAAIDLRAAPFNRVQDWWTSRVDYQHCQELEAKAREAGVDWISYRSVRDPKGRENGALLDPSVFAATGPSQIKTWRLWCAKDGIYAIHELSDRFCIPFASLAKDPRIADRPWVDLS